jgi:hypothetical protein
VTILEKARTCAVCNQVFANVGGLEEHIKSHEITKTKYYAQFFARKDMLTGEELKYTRPIPYSETFFKNKKNMYSWMLGNPMWRERFCREVLELHLSNKGISIVPNHLYLLTHPRLPKKEHFGQSIYKIDFAKQVWTKEMKKCVNDCAIPKELSFITDTREQTPLSLSYKNRVMKLDFGDYTLDGDWYNYCYIDRKSQSDFIGTMSSGKDRFKRELERARGFGAYVFVVSECSLQSIFRNNLFSRKLIDFSLETMREIIVEFSDCCQFVFSGSKASSESLAPFLLYYGNKLKNVDVQYDLERLLCLG